MKEIGEFDHELLEDYLDDALSPAQVQHVARRVADEPELALALHELRAARVLRVSTFRGLEPSEAEAQAVAEGVSRMVRRETHREQSRRARRLGWGVAAAVMMLAAGWALHGPLSSPDRGDVQTRGNKSVAIDASSDGAASAGQDRDAAQDLIRFEASRRDAVQGTAILISDHF